MESIVVLNKRWQYHDEVNLKKFLNWMSNEKVEVLVENDNLEFRSSTRAYKMPMVVRLRHYPEKGQGRIIMDETIQYSDQAVYERDGNQCQYYHVDDKGRKYIYTCSRQERTIDHIKPRMFGGKRTFKNCVCCCRTCNTFKGNQTPEEAGMELIRKPFVPKAEVGKFITVRFNYNPDKIAHRYYMEKIMGKTVSI